MKRLRKKIPAAGLPLKTTYPTVLHLRVLFRRLQFLMVGRQHMRMISAHKMLDRASWICF